MWRLLLLSGLLVLFACNTPRTEEWVADPPSLVASVDYDPLFFENDAERSQALRRKPFGPLLKTVTDSAALLQELLETYRPQTTTESARLNRMERQALFGREDSIWLLDLSWPAADCARHRQFVFNGEGQLLLQSTAQKWGFYFLLEAAPPFLVLLDAPCGGEGHHQIMRGTEEGLIDIFNPLIDPPLPTFDALPNAFINKPHELELLVVDENQDGWNDLLFVGERLQLENAEEQRYSETKPLRKEQLRWVFLYHPVKQQFLAVENYWETQPILLDAD